MKRPYQIAGFVLLAFAAYVAREAIELQYYTPLGPGPGFFPLWLSGFLALLAGRILYQATFGDTGPMPTDFFPTREGVLRIVAILTALVATVMLMVPMGFRVTTLAFYLLLLFALGRVNVLATVLVSLVGSFGVFYVFNDLLRVPLPVGMLGL